MVLILASMSDIWCSGSKIGDGGVEVWSAGLWEPEGDGGMDC